MKKLVYCKACGYIFEEGKYKFCPACGVPEKMFAPYEDKIPADRRKILKLDIHPVVVHAPQAIAFIVLLLAGAMVVLSQFFSETMHYAADLAITIKVLCLILPVTVIGAIVTGVLDAKYRYKVTNTIALNRKKLVGSIFFVCSIGMLFMSMHDGFISEFWVQGLFIAANLGAFACTAILGIWGAKLTHGIMGGPMPKKKKAGAAEPAATPEGE